MGAIQDSAELAVRNLLKRLEHERSGEDISAVDYMDDGTPIQLKVTINPTDGSAIFDFTGTGPEVYGNFVLYPSVQCADRDLMRADDRKLECSDCHLQFGGHFRPAVHGQF